MMQLRTFPTVVNYKCKAILHSFDNIKRAYALFKQLFFEIEVNIMAELLLKATINQNQRR